MGNWQTRSLEEVVKFIDYRGRTPNKTEDGMRLITAKNVKMGYLQSKPMEFVDPEIYDSWMTRGIPKKGDVLFTTEAPLGNVAQLDTDEKVVFAQRIIVMQPDREVLDSTFLKYMLLSDLMQKRIHEKGTGATVQGIKAQLLKKVQISFPESLHEQKRIVAIVDEAFEGIDRAIANTQKNLTNARELFESYLNTILSGQGKQWKETTLGKEIDLLTGFAFKSSGYTDSDKSIRLLRGDNIIPGSLRWDGVKRWPESKVNEYLRYRLQEGDVVLAMDRPWIKTGLRRAQISKDDLPCLLVQRTACLRGGDNLENRFLLYLISGRAFTQHVLGSQTGLSVPHISGTQIQSFKFSKPSLREQCSIIDSLDELKSETKRLEAIYQQKLTALTELKQSILQKAFTGELTADTANQATETAKEVIAA